MRLRPILLYLAIITAALAGAGAARAQTMATDDPAVADGPASAIPDQSIDWSALNVDAFTLMQNPAARLPQDKRSKANDTASAWSSRDNPNGSAAVTVKQSVTPFWDTKVGADLSVARNGEAVPGQIRPEPFQPDPLQPWNRTDRSTGAAWATMTAPGVGQLWDKTAIEARIDPFEDRNKLGTRLSKSLPLADDQYTLTLQNGFNLEQHGVIPGLPLTGRAARTVEIDRTARLRINETGLSLIAGQTFSHADDRWRGKVGAEQDLFGGVNVTGSVSQTPEGVLNKTLSAGFKRSW